MTTTVPQLPQVPQKTQPPQGAPSSSVNNPAFNNQQLMAHPAQFAQPVYVLPEQENTHSGLDYCDGLGHYRCSWAD